MKSDDRFLLDLDSCNTPNYMGVVLERLEVHLCCSIPLATIAVFVSVLVGEEAEN